MQGKPGLMYKHIGGIYYLNNYAIKYVLPKHLNNI